MQPRLKEIIHKEINPSCVFGFILFNSINFLEAISRVQLLDFANSEIVLMVESPIDLFGTLIILSKDKSSIGWWIHLK